MDNQKYKAARQELDLFELSAMASGSADLLPWIAGQAEQLLATLRGLPDPGITSKQLLERFAALQDLHHNKATPDTMALLSLLALGRRELADGKTVSLEEAVQFSKEAGKGAAASPMPPMDQIEEAQPGPMTDIELARILAGGTRRKVQ